MWLVYPNPTLPVLYIYIYIYFFFFIYLFIYIYMLHNDDVKWQNRRKSGLSPSGLRITEAIPAQGHETRGRRLNPTFHYTASTNSGTIRVDPFYSPPPLLPLYPPLPYSTSSAAARATFSSTRPRDSFGFRPTFMRYPDTFSSLQISQKWFW